MRHSARCCAGRRRLAPLDELVEEEDDCRHIRQMQVDTKCMISTLMKPPQEPTLKSSNSNMLQRQRQRQATSLWRTLIVLAIIALQALTLLTWLARPIAADGEWPTNKRPLLPLSCMTNKQISFATRHTCRRANPNAAERHKHLLPAAHCGPAARLAATRRVDKEGVLFLRHSRRFPAAGLEPMSVFARRVLVRCRAQELVVHCGQER